MKTCTVCKKTLGYTHYHKSKISKDGYGYRCVNCDKKAREKYRLSNKERFYLVSRKKQLKFKYGITLEEYETLLKKQNGVCACCKSDNSIGGKTRKEWNLAVDHDHTSGKIRGLLCNQCNRAIGMLGDSVEGLTKALDYLKKETH